MSPKRQEKRRRNDRSMPVLRAGKKKGSVGELRVKRLCEREGEGKRPSPSRVSERKKRGEREFEFHCNEYTEWRKKKKEEGKRTSLQRKRLLAIR